MKSLSIYLKESAGMPVKYRGTNKFGGEDPLTQPKNTRQEKLIASKRCQEIFDDFQVIIDCVQSYLQHPDNAEYANRVSTNIDDNSKHINQFANGCINFDKSGSKLPYVVLTVYLQVIGKPIFPNLPIAINQNGIDFKQSLRFIAGDNNSEMPENFTIIEWRDFVGGLLTLLNKKVNKNLRNLFANCQKTNDVFADTQGSNDPEFQRLFNLYYGEFDSMSTIFDIDNVQIYIGN